MEDQITEIEIAEMMIAYGGGFVASLGEMLLRADPMNVAIIKKTWPEYWEKYRLIAVGKKAFGGQS